MDLEELGLPNRRALLADLGEIFTEPEVWSVVKELPADRAPGLDGFVGAFYHRAWGTIKHEIMAAVLKLFVGDVRAFGKLNRAMITLIPKISDMEDVGDFRPISLVHNFAKLFSKLLANRLRPKMENLVSCHQPAFIKGRNLHDNFILVRQMARRINSRKEVVVLLKLDISRAFDSLSWSFLLEVLRRMGFPDGWATEKGLLSPIGRCTQVQRLSIFADDIVIFVKPLVCDLVMVRELLKIFGEASGLQVNYRKTAATLIRGGELERDKVSTILQCQLTEFPIRYLGLQLALNPLTRAQWQPMIDASTRIAPAWQHGLIAKPGRLVLVQAVMSAMPIHHLLITEAPVWVFEELEKILRGLFWASKERANGGQCLVAWEKIWQNRRSSVGSELET
ncbi:hypothetical protein ACQ4PT_020948 [Festuca glaucescens]